jgi:hypothetical protein
MPSLLRVDNFRDATASRAETATGADADFRTHRSRFVLPFLDKFDPNRLIRRLLKSPPSTRSPSVAGRGQPVREVVSVGDEGTGPVIESDVVVILVDLNGNTEGNRLLRCTQAGPSW